MKANHNFDCTHTLSQRHIGTASWWRCGFAQKVLSSPCVPSLCSTTSPVNLDVSGLRFPVKVLLMAGEVAQWIKSMPCEYEILSMDPQNPYKAGCFSLHLWSLCSYRENRCRGQCIPEASESVPGFLTTEKKETLPKSKWEERTDSHGCPDF